MFGAVLLSFYLYEVLSISIFDTKIQALVHTVCATKPLSTNPSALKPTENTIIMKKGDRGRRSCGGATGTVDQARRRIPRQAGPAPGGGHRRRPYIAAF